MKKIIALSSIVLLAIFGLVACGTNSQKLSKENIDRIHFTITNGSNYQFQETAMNIKEKEMVSSIVDYLDELDLSKKNEVKDTGGLVGADTYTLDLNRGTKFVRRYMIYGDYITIGKEKNHTMFNVRKDNLEIRNCVWFSSDDVFNEIASISHADIAFKLKLETFKDRYMYKMYVEDMQLPRKEENIYERYNSLYNTVFPIETVIYTRKKLENSDLKLVYHDYEVDVTLNRNYLTTLDNQTAYLLLEMRKNYGYNFKVSIKDIILKEENYNVHLVIDRDYEFVSYSLKQGELFRDIKNFLLGDFNYNSIQKNILASVFKEKKNTLAVVEKGRGVNTVIQTIGLYYKSLGEKVLLITDEVPCKKTLNCVDIADDFQEGYSFYIVDKKIDFSILKNKKSLIFSSENIELEGFNKIVDSYTIPENIIFMEEGLISKKNIFSNMLPITTRKNILASLNKYSVLYCSRDILLYL